MKKIILFILLAIIISGCSNNIKQICFEKNCFKVETAKTQQERETGLMNITYLNEDKGMLFIFDEEGIYSFWMKNTLIPLDIIWIDSSNKVVFIKESASLCTNKCETISPNKKAKYVLEVNSGLVKKLNIKIGNIANFY